MQGGFLKGRETKGIFGSEVSKGSSEKSKSLNVIEKAYGGRKSIEGTGASSSKRKYVTDKGKPITIDEPWEPDTRSPEEVRQNQYKLQQAFKKEGLQAQQLSDYDPSHNCHSYTFTDGKAGPINDSRVIEQIIQDNFQSITSRDHNGRYTYTKKPQEEDIIVYWNDNHDAVHSGVISRFDNDPKEMLVKSKMSEYGLFKHSAILPEALKTAFAQAFHGLLPERLKIALLPEELKITYWEIYHRPAGRLIKEVPSSDEA